MSDDVVEACPRCERAEIHERRRHKPKYRCLRCGFEFNQPLVREPIRPQGRGEGTLAVALENADPDDFPAKGRGRP